jgi:hypothetical protein
MDNFLAALKLLIPIILTPIINKFISTFRVRQLYLSYEDVHPCAIEGHDGYIANFRIYNKGKDKETNVEITLPNTSECQILSSNYPEIKALEQKVVIDRILPKQVVFFSAYLKSAIPLSDLHRPFLKSEDANGKTYNNREKVPPSLGPSMMGLSVFFAVMITFAYVTYSGVNIFYPYYAIRYEALLAQGFKPLIFSRIELAASLPSSKSPLTVDNARTEEAKIVISLTIKNPTPNRIVVSVYPDLGDDEYRKEFSKASDEIFDLSEKVAAWRVIDSKYGYTTDDSLRVDDFPLNPGQDRVLHLKKSVISTTTPENLNLSISIKGAKDPATTEYYNFKMRNSKEYAKVSELIKKLAR